MSTKVLTIQVELTESELEELLEIADRKDMSVKSLLLEAINDKFGLTGE